MPKTRGNIKRRKRILMAEHPFCFWCGIKVVKRWPIKGQNNDNIATIDHLDSRNKELKEIVLPNGARTVLSCKKCNQERNDREQRELSTVCIKKISDI